MNKLAVQKIKYVKSLKMIKDKNYRNIRQVDYWYLIPCKYSVKYQYF
jgi:hypothetical protein